MELIQQGIAEGLIRFDDGQKNIFYIHQDKRHNYNNPEEQVQTETFLKLVLEYGYPVTHIQQFVPVKMGISTKEADIVVYKDAACSEPYIIVECKNADISEQEFTQAREQAFSYAHALAGTTKFIWITKGNREEFYQFDKEKNQRLPLSNIPDYGKKTVEKYRYTKGGLSDVKKVSEAELTKIFKQAHDALWAGGERNLSEAFDELIFVKSGLKKHQRICFFESNNVDYKSLFLGRGRLSNYERN